MTSKLFSLLFVLVILVGCSSKNEDVRLVSERGENEADTGAIMPAPQQAPMESFAAGAPSPAATQGAPAPAEEPADMFFEDYGVNPMIDAAEDNLSTFAMDVDTASYTLARSYLQDYDQLPPPEAIRPEEFVNYFEAGYPNPEDAAFGIQMDMVNAPFSTENKLLRVGIQGRSIAPEDRTPAFLVFVIDVSGSMDMENRLGLVKESLALLVEALREDDRIAIAVYSDNSRVVLNPTPASEKETILASINALRPEGSTNVDAGLRLAYKLALAEKRDAEITRVIVLSDGVANVDVTSPQSILQNIQEGVQSGVTLSTIGFGMGNYNDVLMERLANDGNGNYYYIDNLRQARRIFVHNLTGTLQVIGYDAKVQVVFNPEAVKSYRLIGYENRAIADEDFRDDSVDAGEVGAGHSITALYELTLSDADLSPDTTVANAFIRYQDADTREVVEQNQPITLGNQWGDLRAAPSSLRLHIAAAEFAELLRRSEHTQANYVALLELAAPLENDFPQDGEVAEFVDLIRLAGRFVDTN